MEDFEHRLYLSEEKRPKKQMRQMRGVHYAYRYHYHLARFFPLLDLTFY